MEARPGTVDDCPNFSFEVEVLVKWIRIWYAVYQIEECVT